MEIKQEAKEVLVKASELLKDPALADVMTKAVTSKSDMTWLDLAGTILPIAIDSVENSQVVLPSKVKSSIVSSIVLPLIKDKLPWYIKPFSEKIISWFIDIIVASLNKLFTKNWAKEVPATEVKAEGTN